MSETNAVELHRVDVLLLIAHSLEEYQIAQKRSRKCREYSKELLSPLHRFLRSARSQFHRRSRLLIRAILNDDQLDQAFLEAEPSLNNIWLSEKLNEKLTKSLATSFDHCEEVFVDTHQALSELNKRLYELEGSTKMHEGESVRKLLRRFHKTCSAQLEYLKNCIMELKTNNKELKLLRDQFEEVQSCYYQTPGEILPKPLVIPYKSIRDASSGLYRALEESWSCDDSRHVEHYAKLCIDAEATPGVQLRMAISRQHTQCENWYRGLLMDTDPSNINKYGFNGPQREKAVRWVDEVDEDDPPPARIKNGNLKQSHRTPAANMSSTFCIQPAAADVLPTYASFFTPQPIQRPDNYRVINLCLELKQNCTDPEQNKCLGYLQGTQDNCNFKYLLYTDSNSLALTSGSATTIATACSLRDILNSTDWDDIEAQDRLQIALKLTRTVLQFHSTAWLNDKWNLSDISLQGPSDRICDKALGTLHLTSKITDLSASRTNVEGNEVHLETGLTTEQAEIKYGIYNLALFSLGQALLELGCWKSLESIRDKRFRTLQDADLIQTARLAAKGCLAEGLGPKYRNLVQKCLTNDFGFGHDLSKERLQAAVHSQIITELEQLIREWKI